MTTVTKPLSRETACLDRGRPLIVTLHPRHLEIRLKGLRRRYTISYDACLWSAIKRELDIEKREKRLKQQEKRRKK